MMGLLTRNAPILVYLVGLAAVLAVAWTVYRQFCGLGKESRPTHAWVIAVFALLTLLVGGVATLREGEARDLEMRADLLRHVEGISAMIRAEDVRKLSFSARDSTNAAFQCLRAQLRAYARAVGDRSIYTHALRAGRTVMGPESLRETDSMGSPPGTLCRPPTAANREMFRNGAALTEGPVGGEHGVFVSAFAPVKDVRTGEVLMAVGMDIDWKEWRQAIARARLVAVFLTWMVLLALAAGGEVVRWQGRTDEPLGRTSPWVEATVAAGIGLAITLAAACWAHDEPGRRYLVLEPGRRAHLWLHERGSHRPEPACAPRAPGLLRRTPGRLAALEHDLDADLGVSQDFRCKHFWITEIKVGAPHGLCLSGSR